MADTAQPKQTQENDKKSDRDRPCEDWSIWKCVDAFKAKATNDNAAASLVTNGDIATILESWARSLPHHETESEDRRLLQSFFNKSSLQQELEESKVALEEFLRWMSTQDDHRQEKDVIVVDLCCGKGVWSLLLSYFWGMMSATKPPPPPPLQKSLQRIILLDRDTDINYHHIHRANQQMTSAFQGSSKSVPNKGHEREEEEEGEGLRSNAHPPLLQASVPMEIWSGCNLHDDDALIQRFEKVLDAASPKRPVVLALVGIHLCKTLSPRAIGIFNALGREKAPFLCLAPCCLPRLVAPRKQRQERKRPPRRDETFGAKGEAIDRGGTVSSSSLSSPPHENNNKQVLNAPVAETSRNTDNNKDSNQNERKSGDYHYDIRIRLYETPQQVAARRESYRLRKMARARQQPQDASCLLCGSRDHFRKHCPHSNSIQRAPQVTPPCWKCGKTGHYKADCPFQDGPAKPPILHPPTVTLPRQEILQLLDENETRNEKERVGDNRTMTPFDAYCQVLCQTVQLHNDDNTVSFDSSNDPNEASPITTTPRSGCRWVKETHLVSRHEEKKQCKTNWNAERKSKFIVVHR